MNHLVLDKGKTALQFLAQQFTVAKMPLGGMLAKHKGQFSTTFEVQNRLKKKAIPWPFKKDFWKQCVLYNISVDHAVYILLGHNVKERWGEKIILQLSRPNLCALDAPDLLSFLCKQGGFGGLN